MSEMIRKKLRIVTTDPKQRIADIKSNRPNDFDISIKVSGLPPDCDFKKIRIRDPESNEWTTETDYFYCDSSFCAKKPFKKRVSFFCRKLMKSM